MAPRRRREIRIGEDSDQPKEEEKLHLNIFNHTTHHGGHKIAKNSTTSEPIREIPTTIMPAIITSPRTTTVFESIDEEIGTFSGVGALIIIIFSG